jgi:hypothetical protein
MNHADRRDILRAVTAWEFAYVANPFESYGNIYFPDDLTPELQALPHDRSKYPGFVVGPICNRQYFEDGRGTIETDRGPCEWDHS